MGVFQSKKRKKQLTKEENSYKVNVSDTNTYKTRYRGVKMNSTINTIKNRVSVRTYQRAELSTAENVEYIATYQLED